MERKITFTQGDRKIEATLDEIRALAAAEVAAERQKQARVDREGLKAALWAVIGFAVCLVILFFT